MAKWYRKAAQERGIDISYEEAREVVYGMPFEEWKDEYQTETSPEKVKQYNEETDKHAF